jgi:hypothetical protein
MSIRIPDCKGISADPFGERAAQCRTLNLQIQASLTKPSFQQRTRVHPLVRKLVDEGGKELSIKSWEYRPAANKGIQR